MENHLEHLQYPIGRLEVPSTYTPQQLQEWVAVLEALPSWLDICIENLDEPQLHTPYRPGGWTIQQVIHHIADSHMNAYIRLKLALTENNPIIKPYAESLWAELEDVKTVPVNISVTLLHALHRRWAAQLRNMPHAAWARTYHHPEQNKDISIWQMTAMYAWHSRHHMEHIRGLRERMNW